VPERVAAAGFRAAADVAVRWQSKGVRRLRVNLRRVVGPQYPEPEFDLLVKSAMRSYGRYWMETFRLPTMDLDEVAARVHPNTEGSEHIDRAMAAAEADDCYQALKLARRIIRHEDAILGRAEHPAGLVAPAPTTPRKDTREPCRTTRRWR